MLAARQLVRLLRGVSGPPGPAEKIVAAGGISELAAEHGEAAGGGEHQ